MPSSVAEHKPDECAECGGDVVSSGGTVKYTYYSCVDCEWMVKKETGSYL